LPSPNFAHRDAAVIAALSTLEHIGSVTIKQLTLVAGGLDQCAAGGRCGPCTPLRRARSGNLYVETLRRE
jgi:hypothetical protein